MITQGETGQTPINLTLLYWIYLRSVNLPLKKKVLSVEKSISTELIIALTN